jgi:flagellar basal-body rod modification protein FlgD
MTTPISSSYPSATITTTAPSNVSTVADQSQLSSQQFLQLLVAQLQYQDPSQPVDNATLMNETATLNQIQTMQQLSQASTNQMQAQQQQTATDMVGRSVSYLDAAGATETGYVSAATIAGTTPTLVVGGQTISLSQVQQVIAAGSGTSA